ncbi:microtubule-associated protein 10 [Centropristis striata]|uniref:microtubule-associated protein 10 n=1 Tax=Centropristis striata TaxID=184440 RepID=UPI0027E03641|nr:microtubule-associated protein 10 [Centropristis striata]
MSGREDSDNLETLFSFELLVEYIRIEKGSKVSDELALGLRLLDFPTLLIYQPQQSSGDANQRQHDGKEKQGEYAFNRGKSCFFKMNMNSLHSHLSNTPLYAMVLDVKEEIPKLVGTSLISLGKAMDRIRQDVTDHGVSTPSSHGERGAVAICNLTGEKIGSISLSYKLLSLGASLLPHITESCGLESTSLPRQQQIIIEKNIPQSLLRDCGNSDVSRHMQNNKPSDENSLINEEDNGVTMQSEHKPRCQMPQESENNFEDDLTILCPPHLFYKNSAEENRKNEAGDCRLLNRDFEAFTFEEEETSENEIGGTSSPMMNQRVNQKTSVTSNVLGDALRQLPLLNALLVELSQLNNQNPNQPCSIHPHLSWIYRPASAEPSAGRGNTPRKAQTKSLQKTRQGTSPNLKLLHSPRNCSTPVARPARDKQEEALIESKNSSKSPRQKLVYGTTKTFNLRLKQISPLKVKRRECMDLLQNQSSTVKEKAKSSHKIIKSSRRKSVINQSSRIDENVETMMQNITADSAQQETITLKHKTLHGKVHGKQDRDSPRISEKNSVSERDLKCIHIPSVDCDSVSQNKDKKKHYSESNQVKSQSESDRHREKIESSTSSSPKSSFSDSSGEENEEADYADDFNSLEPSDAYSPDPMSSPEPSRAKTSRSPVRLDLCNSDSEGFHKRAVLPVPIKAPSSPVRSLRGTHVIRPRTHASALSFSSEDGDRDGSLQTICSRKQMKESSRVDRSSGAESLISSRGQRSGSAKNSGPVRGLSLESVSSFEPHEVEELEDELGSLDFKKEYQHISELVANKLPGYTM